MYKRVMAVDVFLWGHHVGRIAPDFGSYYQFQYDPEFIRTGIQIAPIHLPLRSEIYKVINMELPKGTFRGLPGVFADSIPDTFGNALIDKWMDELISYLEGNIELVKRRLAGTKLKVTDIEGTYLMWIDASALAAWVP